MISHPLRERALPLFLAYTISLGTVACATLDRPDETLTRLSGGYLSVESRSELHKQGAVTLAVQHAGASGYRAGAVLSWIRGAAEEEVFGSDGDFARAPKLPRDPTSPPPPPAPIASERRPYTFFSAGASFGYERRFIGLEMGAHLLFSTGRSFLPMPWLNLKLGDLTSVWGEFKLGSEGGATDPMWISAGVGFKTTWLRGRVGIGLGTRATVDAFDDDREVELFGRDPTFAGWAELTWTVARGIGVWIRGAGGEEDSFSVEAGLVVALAHLFGSR